MRMKRHNNKGFTLVELLIVVTISLLMLTIVLISYNVVNNANVNKAARRLETVIKTARVQSMSKGSDAGKLTLTVEHGNLYAVIGDPATEQKELICNGGVAVRGLTCTDDYTIRPALGDLGTTNIASATVTFKTNGSRKTLDDSPNMYNKFTLSRGHRHFEVIVYDQTGTVVVNMF